ncbi:MAG TPA: DUF4190 domain-containing protein [Clostridia bacterium]|nr:DUF4190 domain-containing protein [Clostridia bacterium]
MGGPPGGAHVSPDGKWWWDGNRWVPMPAADPSPGAAQAQLPVPYQQMSPAYPAAVYAYGPPTNSFAVASLAFGIISWLVCPFIGGVVAIILGHVARGQIRTSGEAGSGMAMAGLVLGYIHLVAVALLIFFWIVLLGGLAALIGIIGTLPVPTPSP